MKWLLALLPGGLLALLVWEFFRRRGDRRDSHMSARWFRERQHQASRIDFVSVCWRWPVPKTVSKPLSEFETARLRRTA